MRGATRRLAGCLAALALLAGCSLPQEPSVFPGRSVQETPARETPAPPAGQDGIRITPRVAVTVPPQAGETPLPTPADPVAEARSAEEREHAAFDDGDRTAGVRREHGAVTLGNLGAVDYLLMEGCVPYVFAPNGAGGSPFDVLSVTDMLSRYGEQYRLLAAANCGIFYDTQAESVYCYAGKNADGVLIAGGTVLKSTESLDHSECDILVIDEDGAVGWADYWADADALIRGWGTYYDVYGQPVTGKRIVSAVTGFVPVLIGGENVYSGDGPLHGYHNYVDHYTERAPRQIFGVREDGASLVLTNQEPWTLREAAEAAKEMDCVFAYNLDGGDSVETAWRQEGEADGGVATLSRSVHLANQVPTYLVFSDAARAPVSATASELRVSFSGGNIFSPGVTVEELAGKLVVTERFQNADGGTSERRVYSIQAAGDEPITHQVLGEGRSPDTARVVSESVSPSGNLFYTKTQADSARSLQMNGNTRADGAYYDYSTGFSLTVTGDLKKPGEKTLHISYVPGIAQMALERDVQIFISG